MNDLGYGNSRRMSERDIPSRIHQEHQEMQMRLQQQQRNGGLNMNMSNINMNAQMQMQMQTPRIQGSKSVPTLNSDQNQLQIQSSLLPFGNSQINQAPQRQPNQLVQSQTSVSHPSNISSNNYRAGYLPQQQQGPVQSGSGYGNVNANYLPPPARPESQQSMNHQHSNRISSTGSQSSYQEERHYQNIQMYQQQNASQQKISPNSINSLQPPQQPQRMLHSSHNSLQHPDGQYNQLQSQQGRPVSAIVSSRDQEQLGGLYQNPPNSPRSPPPNSHQTAFNLDPYNQNSYSNSQMAYPRQMSQQSDQIDFGRTYPGAGGNNPSFMDVRQRDLMRQEAKMEEMRDEIRRREERMAMMKQQQQYPPNQQNWNQRIPSQQQIHPGLNGQTMPMRLGPQPAPKPRPQFGSLPPSGSGSSQSQFQSQGSLRQQIPYREQQELLPSQANLPPPAVSYRYGQSGYPPSRQGDPIKLPITGSLPGQRSSASQNALNNKPNEVQSSNRSNSGVVSPSPWEREEREKVK